MSLTYVSMKLYASYNIYIQKARLRAHILSVISKFTHSYTNESNEIAVNYCVSENREVEISVPVFTWNWMQIKNKNKKYSKAHSFLPSSTINLSIKLTITLL